MCFKLQLDFLHYVVMYVILTIFIKFLVDPYYETLSWFIVNHTYIIMQPLHNVCILFIGIILSH